MLLRWRHDGHVQLSAYGVALAALKAAQDRQIDGLSMCRDIDCTRLKFTDSRFLTRGHARFPAFANKPIELRRLWTL